MANMMKKILILFLMIFVSGTSYAADFSDFVRKWVKDSGEGIAWCGCTCESNLDNGSVCIGTEYNKCDGENFAPVKLSDSNYGKIVMMLVKAREGGALFCPVIVAGQWAIGSDGSHYSSIYYKRVTKNNDGCVWLCHAGYSGSECDSLVHETYEGVCNNSPLWRNNYRTLTYDSNIATTLDEKDIVSRGDAYDCSSSCGTWRHHDMIFVISGWLDSGHGAYVRPYVMEAGRGHIADVSDSVNGVNTYPASWGGSCNPYVDGYDTNGVPIIVSYGKWGKWHDSKLGCMVGYEPSDNGTDCVPINPELCNDATTGGNGDGGELPPGGGTGVCDGTLRSGVRPGTSECITCPMGQIFNKDAVNASYCEDTIKISNDVLLYGGGNSATSITNQCWPKTKLKDYKNCVKRGM